MSAWLAEHHLGIGGSESAALLGKNKYKSALAVYWEKVSAPAYDPDEDAQEHLTWGRVLEEPILREFGRRKKFEIEMGGELLWSKKYPHMLATIDAYLPKLGQFAECKTTSMGSRYPNPLDPTDDTEIPMEVQIQIQQGLCVTGMESAYAVWLPLPERTLGNKLQPEHLEFQAMLGEAIETFWSKHVEKQVPPAPDGTESSKEAIQLMYPDPTSQEAIELGEEWLARKREFDEKKLQAKALDAEIERIKQEMQMALGDHAGAVLPDNSMITYKTLNRKPAVCSECHHETPRSSYRKLGFKKKAPAGLKLVEPEHTGAKIIDLADAPRQSLEAVKK